MVFPEVIWSAPPFLTVLEQQVTNARSFSAWGPMRHALIVLLIAMLAWLGPVSGAAAHTHEVGADHHHAEISSDHHHDDFHAHRATDREIDLAKMSKPAGLDSSETGDVMLHAHIHMDGAPLSAGMSLQAVHKTGPVRSLSNFAPEPDPGLGGLRRPPKPNL